jgi:hypothetical protein
MPITSMSQRALDARGAAALLRAGHRPCLTAAGMSLPASPIESEIDRADLAVPSARLTMVTVQQPSLHKPSHAARIVKEFKWL